MGYPWIQKVQEASAYRVFLFLLPQTEIIRIFPGATWRRASQEYLSDGGSYREVTTALYLSPEEVQVRPFLKEWLAKAISLESVKPQEAPKPRIREP